MGTEGGKQEDTLNWEGEEEGALPWERELLPVPPQVLRPWRSSGQHAAQTA